VKRHPSGRVKPEVNKTTREASRAVTLEALIRSDS